MRDNPAQGQYTARRGAAAVCGSGSVDETRRFLRVAPRRAAQGHARAQYNAAWALLNGRGIDRDPPRAAAWLRAAAEAGVMQVASMRARAHAQCGLGAGPARNLALECAPVRFAPCFCPHACMCARLMRGRGRVVFCVNVCARACARACARGQAQYGLGA
jgi:TPR repeat protein